VQRKDKWRSHRLYEVELVRQMDYGQKPRSIDKVIQRGDRDRIEIQKMRERILELKFLGKLDELDAEVTEEYKGFISFLSDGSYCWLFKDYAKSRCSKSELYFVRGTTEKNIRYALWQLEETEVSGIRYIRGYIECRHKTKVDWLMRNVSNTAIFVKRNRENAKTEDFCEGPGIKLGGPWELNRERDMKYALDARDIISIK